MKTLTHYEDTKMLFSFISENWSNYSIGVIKTILTEAKEKLEERIETTVTLKNLERILILTSNLSTIKTEIQLL